MNEWLKWKWKPSSRPKQANMTEVNTEGVFTKCLSKTFLLICARRFIIFRGSNCWGCEEANDKYKKIDTASVCLPMGACCRFSLTLKTPHRPTFNRLHLLWSQTHLDYSLAAKLSTNKGNGTLHHPSLWKVALERRKNLWSYLTNASLFEVQTRKNEGIFFRTCTPYDSNFEVLCTLAQACGLW